MTNEQIDLWIAALRSGDHKQTQLALARNAEGNHASDLTTAVSHCCVGVAALVCGETQVSGVFADTADISQRIKLPMFGPSSIGGRLVEMNDNFVSFAQIAEYIERNRQEVLDGEARASNRNESIPASDGSANERLDEGDQPRVQQ